VAGLSLASLSLTENERIGVLLELGGAMLDPGVMAGVSITATSSSALGVVAQGGAATAGWDDDVTRGGTTSANDAAHTGDLSTVGIVGPCFMPPVDLEIQGLDALVGR
jgi:hypothetical protein